MSLAGFNRMRRKQAAEAANNEEVAKPTPLVAMAKEQIVGLSTEDFTTLANRESKPTIVNIIGDKILGIKIDINLKKVLLIEELDKERILLNKPEEENELVKKDDLIPVGEEVKATKRLREEEN